MSHGHDSGLGTKRQFTGCEAMSGVGGKAENAGTSQFDPTRTSDRLDLCQKPSTLTPIIGSGRFVGGGRLAEFALPDTQYAQSDEISIAYQVMGDGPVDL